MAVSRRPTGGGHLFSTFGLTGNTSAILVVASTFLLLNIGTVDAHGYLMSPRSRNFLAHSSQDGKGQYGSTATDPKVDYEVRSILLFLLPVCFYVCSMQTQPIQINTLTTSEARGQQHLFLSHQ